MSHSQHLTLTLQIRELTEALVEVQNQLEKVTRDKVTLLAEVDEARQQVRVDIYATSSIEQTTLRYKFY